MGFSIEMPRQVVQRAAVAAAFDAQDALDYAQRLLSLPAAKRGVPAHEIHAQVLRARKLARRLREAAR